MHESLDNWTDDMRTRQTQNIFNVYKYSLILYSNLTILRLTISNASENNFKYYILL